MKNLVFIKSESCAYGLKIQHSESRELLDEGCSPNITLTVFSSLALLVPKEHGEN